MDLVVSEKVLADDNGCKMMTIPHMTLRADDLNKTLVILTTTCIFVLYRTQHNTTLISLKIVIITAKI
jgi:hypothetical protein